MLKTRIINTTVGALLSLVGVVVGVYLNEHMTARRDLQRFQVESFEEYEQQFLFRDPELKRIRVKFENTQKHLTDDEMAYYLGFFEDVGTFSKRNLIDFDLVDNLLGPYILECYDSSEVIKWIKKSRADDNEPTEFENFEVLASQLEAKDAAEKEARLRGASHNQ